MLYKLITLFLIAAFSNSILAQAAAPAPKADEKSEQLRKNAIELLRETADDVARMRTPENRVSLNAELASLMWYSDEKEAKAMYGVVVGDFKQLLAQIDARTNSGEPNDDEDEFGGGLFGSMGRGRAERKMRTAMAVRQQIALSLADHAPELAYNFFLDTGSMIASPAYRAQNDISDRRFGLQLLQRIARADAAKGIDYGRASLKDGIKAEHVELLKSIYAKDVERGREFGAELFSRLGTDRSSLNDLGVYGPLLSFGDENAASPTKENKKAVYSAAELRSIAEMAASALLDGTAKEDNYTIGRYADLINKYAPGRGTQLRAKFKGAGSSGQSEEEILRSISNEVGGMNTASNSMSGAAYASSSNTNTSNGPRREQIEAERRQKEEEKMEAGVASLTNKDLPPDERAKISADARRIIAKSRGAEKKIIGLSFLAAQVSRSGDKELAAEIMRDAERLANPQPRNYKDFALTLMLVSGYAEADAQKAFPIIDGLILRANDLIAASIKMAEFVDVNEEIFEDGELQVGAFGGSMIRELTGGLGVANGTIRSLAEADMVKTRKLADTFDRSEIRILAKMMIIRAVVDKRKGDKDHPSGDRPDAGETDLSDPAVR